MTKVRLQSPIGSKRNKGHGRQRAHIVCCILSYGSRKYSSVSNKNSEKVTYMRCRMRRTSVIAIGLVVLIIAAVVIILAYTSMPSTPKPEPSPIIKVDPANVTKHVVNSTFTVNVTVENCVNVYAVQVDIRFNPNVLNLINISEGPFLPSAGPTLVMKANSSSNNDTQPLTAGAYFVDTHFGSDVTGASGNGTLFAITFQVLSEGSTQFQFFPYTPRSSSIEGTYFMKVNQDQTQTEIIPELHNGSYG